jgi:hypothetical protein
MNSSTAALILTIPISQVYRKLTGMEPRRAGPDRWRAKATDWYLRTLSKAGKIVGKRSLETTTPA